MKIAKVLDNQLLCMDIITSSNLSLESIGIIFQMANVPECDYIEINELKKFFPSCQEKQLSAAVTELLLKNYLFKINNKLILNKKIVSQMKLIG